jgi:hypothetical protein
MGRAARARVEARFSLRGSVAAAEQALEDLVRNGQLNTLREDVAEQLGPRPG